MSANTRGKLSTLPRTMSGNTDKNSAFWGKSFVAELTRLSAHGEKKLKLRRASLARAPSQAAFVEVREPSAQAWTNGHVKATTNGKTQNGVHEKSDEGLQTANGS